MGYNHNWNWNKKGYGNSHGGNGSPLLAWFFIILAFIDFVFICRKELDIKY